jgi:hypothetical protein
MTFLAIGTAIGEAVAFEITFGAAAFGAVSTFIASGVAMLGRMAVMSVIAKAAAPDLPAQSRAILVNGQGTVEALPVIYGLRRIAGNRVFVHVSAKSGSNPVNYPDKTNAYLHQVIAFSEGEISDIANLRLENKAITDINGALWNYVRLTGQDAQAARSELVTATTRTFSGTYSQSGTVITVTKTAHARAVGGIVTLDFTSGSAVDGTFTIVSVPSADTFTVTAGASLTTSGNVSATDSLWTSAHTLSGVAYIWLLLVFNPESYPQIPNFTADLSGRLVYDPRTGSTAWSDNPALCIRDYLTNARYGRGVSTADIDDAAIIVAANYCDELVAKPGGTQKRYTCNAVIDTNQPALDNLKNLLATCRGILVYTGGKYRLRIDKPETAAFTFNEDNIIGAWSIKLGDKRARFNRIRATWIDKDHDWQAGLTVRDSTTFRSADNGLMLEAQIEYPYVTDPYQVQRLVDMNLKQSRFGITVSFTASIAGTVCEVGDVVAITHSTPGWTAKPFRIMRIALLSSDEVEVTCTEYDDSIYVADTLTAPRSSQISALPVYAAPAAPTGLTLASGDTHRLISPDGIVAPRIYASWTISADAYATGYEVQFKKSTESVYQTVNLAAVETGTYLAPVQYGVIYDVRIRAVSIAGFNSAWVSGTHTVTASPSQPNDLPIDIQTFTSGGTWTKPSRGRLAFVECWGGGGGGGRSPGGSGGGGGGLYVSAWIPLASIGATETVSIGAGGASRTTVGSGNNGGNTTFSALVTAYGGQGGAANSVAPNTNPGGAGGGAYNTTDVVRGMNGAGDGAYYVGAAILPVASPVGGGGGGGGSVFWGARNGGAASLYGGGGGGGSGGASPGAGGISQQGGNGGAGNNSTNATAGAEPGGGGGGAYSGNSGAGGNGKCKVTVW